MEIASYKNLKSWSVELDGVFTIRDLQIGFAKRSIASLYKDIEKLVAAEELFRVKRGVYATPEASLVAIATRIYPESYVTTSTVLAKNLVIGSVPAKRVQMVKVGAPRKYSFPLGSIEFLSITPKLFFGFSSKNGVKWATPEKGFLDACYFYYKGKSFSFNLDSDISYEFLDWKLINKYLTKYDQRFLTFFQKRWGKP